MVIICNKSRAQNHLNLIIARNYLVHGGAAQANDVAFPFILWRIILLHKCFDITSSKHLCSKMRCLRMQKGSRTGVPHSLGAALWGRRGTLGIILLRVLGGCCFCSKSIFVRMKARLVDGGAAEVDDIVFSFILCEFHYTNSLTCLVRSICVVQLVARG